MSETGGREIISAKSWLIPGLIILAGLILSAYFLTSNTKIITTQESITYGTTTESDPKLLKGMTYTRVPGTPGTKTVKTKVWLGKNGNEKSRKVVAEIVEQDPQNEVIAEGTLSRSDAASEARTAVQNFMTAWKNGEYEAMVSQSTAESLKGFTAAIIQQGYQATGEVLESFTVGEPTIKTMVELGSEQTSSSSGYTGSSVTGYASEKKPKTISPSDFPEGTPVIAEIPISYSSNSKALAKKTSNRFVYAAYRDGSWRILYFDQLAGVAVNQNKQLSETKYSSTDTVDVALDYVIIYPDHILITVHETNTTHSKYGSRYVSSHFSVGYSGGSLLVVTDAQDDPEFILVSDKSTKFESSIKEGVTQSGYLYVEPGIPADAKSLSVTFKEGSGSDSKRDVFFNNITFR